MHRQTDSLKKVCIDFGADFVGVADLSLLVGEVGAQREVANKFPFALSIAIKLDDGIVNEIENCPTKDYADHYRDVNRRLDEVAKKCEEYIVSLGYKALAIPASKVVDEKNLLGTLSHKAVARLAGLGWQGKSLLIINPYVGPRFRLVTILTDMKLVADKPIKNRCGACHLCSKHCPANAIKNVKTETYYSTRDEAISLSKCYQKLLEFKSRDGIDATVCGVCVKVCPFGRRKKS